MHDRHTHNTPITILSFYSLTHFSLSHTFIQSILLLHSSSENHSVSTHTHTRVSPDTPFNCRTKPSPPKSKHVHRCTFFPSEPQQKMPRLPSVWWAGGLVCLLNLDPCFYTWLWNVWISLSPPPSKLSVNVRLGEVLTSLFTMSTVCLTSRTCQYVSLQASERTLSVWLPGILFVFPDSFTVNTSRLFILSG